MKHKFPIDIKVIPEYINICNEFVENSYNSNVDYYAKRNQNDVSKIKHDIYYGKLAEFAVYQYLSITSDVTKPDTQVYNKYKKSFDADLIIDYRFNLHVKSQHICFVDKFGLSWNFQKEDLLITKPSDNDYVCLCSIVDLSNVRIVAIKKASDLVDKYKEPILEKLKSIKKVLYYSDI